MIFLSTKKYEDLLLRATQAELAREDRDFWQKKYEEMLERVLAMKAEGAELPPGFGEPGFERYTFDEVETAESGEHVEPRPVLVDDEVDPETIADMARALGFDH